MTTTNVICGRCDKPAGDVGVAIVGRTIRFCGLACTIAFLEDLFEAWAQSMAKVRLN